MNGRYTVEPRYLGKLQPYEAESPTHQHRIKEKAQTDF